MIKLDRDFWEVRTFFEEDEQGFSVVVVNKETGEIDCYYMVDEIEKEVMNDLKRKNRLLKNIKENPSRYFVITVKADTVDNQIVLMKEYDFVPEGGFPSAEELENYKKHS